MQLTLQADELRRFREIVRWMFRKPRNLMVHWIEFHGKPALALHFYDWSIVMPVRGRKPTTTFQIPYRCLCDVPQEAEGKVTVKIHPKKRIGQVHWFALGARHFSPPFGFSLADYRTVGAPSDAAAVREYPVSLLDDLWRCAKRCLNPQYPNLTCLHITPDGELRTSDGHFALGIQTAHTFDCEEQTLIRTCTVFGKRNLRRNKSFRLSFNGKMVHFDFGDFHFFTKPQIERYPDLNKTFPQDDTTRTRLTLDPADAAFLKKHLDDLPGRKETDAPVTLLCDYDNTISVHGSQTDREKTKAILLVRSTYDGQAYHVATNRKHLQDALSLGCLDFKFGTSYPLASTDTVRFCWMPIDGGALPLESERPIHPAVLFRSDQPFTEKGKP